ncbi:MAG: nucleoside-diphosphate kinase [Rikenellaceae bacterium]|nr:nucleoside-diphosphate kinase [Rikenellaceae bacterium]
MKTRSFTIVKPNAVAAGNTGRILEMLAAAGFTVRALKMVCFSRNDAYRFYADHIGKTFFGELVEFMTSGPSVVAVVEREDAVTALRQLVGATDPAKAAEGTIRRLYGESLTRNAVHASDSDGHAQREWSQWFTPDEIMEAEYHFKEA